MDKTPYYIRGDIDNQIGFLKDIICYHLQNNYLVLDIGGLNFKPHDKNPEVLISSDVIPIKLAMESRDFVNKIPFDTSLQLLNDTDNQPHDDLYKRISSQEMVKKAYEDRILDPNKWMWEKYSIDIWRVLPLTLEALCGSPLFELISVLESLWLRNSFIDVSKFKKVTWVLQRIEHGNGIKIHNDEYKGRQVSFVYYLTPDDWSLEDGGNLHVLDSNDKEIIIQPKFNTMVSWKNGK